MGIFLNLLFPTHCQVCGLPGDPVCSTCKPVSAPRWVTPNGLNTLSLSILEGATAAILTGYKDKNLVALKPYLAGLVHQSEAEISQLKFHSLVVPPRNPKNFARRGFDPALDIARAGFLRRYPITSLNLARKIQDQRTLKRTDRQLNISGSFVLKSQVPGPVLIFDDVLTTGATVSEMRRALESAGVEIAGACVLAQRI